MADIWAIVPVRSIKTGKSRLAPFLEPSVRRLLNAGLMRNTLITLRALRELSGCIVVSDDDAAIAIGREFGATILNDTPAYGYGAEAALNASVDQAVAFVANRLGATSLVVPCDLACAGLADFRSAISMSAEQSQPVIAADERKCGTNLLLLPVAVPFRADFGKGSFSRHSAQLFPFGAVSINVPGLAFDLDGPDDLALLDRDFAELVRIGGVRQ